MSEEAIRSLLIERKQRGLDKETYKSDNEGIVTDPTGKKKKRVLHPNIQQGSYQMLQSSVLT